MLKAEQKPKSESRRHAPIWLVVFGVLAIFVSSYIAPVFGFTPSELGRVEIAVLVSALVFAVIFMDTAEERRAWWQKRQETLEKARKLHARLDTLEDRLDRRSQR